MNSLNGSIHHSRPQRKDEKALDGTPFLAADSLGDDVAITPPNLVGLALTSADYSALEARWIDRALADRAALRRVDSLTGGDIVGRRGDNYAGILIPYFRSGSAHVREYRLRRDQPELEYDASGGLKPRQKYLGPPGRSNMLYLAPGVSQALFMDRAVPVVITEGEFKTLALWRLASHRPRISRGFCRLVFPVSTTGAAPSARQPARTAAGWMSRAPFPTLTGSPGRAAAW